MKKINVAAVAALFTSALVFGACNSPSTVLPHKLVATSGQDSVPMYPDEQSFLKVSHNAQEGGVTGVVGNVQKDVTAKKIDNETPVTVLSSDSNGSEVEITDGPMKGQAGFVANQNVD